MPARSSASRESPPAFPSDARGAFRVRHAPGAPTPWWIELAGAAALALPEGLPWKEGEARPARPALLHEVAGAPWDAGRFTLDAGVLALDGRKLKARFETRFDGARPRLRRLDAPSPRAMPGALAPMLASAGSYPTRPEEYAFEPKWDGIRALAHVAPGKLKLRTRNGHDVTRQYPELAPLPDALAPHEAVLDGEIVAPDATGRPSFQRIQARLGVADAKEAAKRAEEVPVVYVVFDVLHLDGRDLAALPYEERRLALERLAIDDDHWRTTPSSVGDGRGYLAMKGWEGVVAKRLGSAYEPGARSRAWVKIKEQRRQEMVIGGWSAGQGSRAGAIGALLVGVYDATPLEARRRQEPARLLYAGSVGTGFTQATLDALAKRLAPLRRATSPFAEGAPRKGATFVEPLLVAEIEFTEWTDEGRLRHPSFKGLRADKDAHEVVREEL